MEKIKNIIKELNSIQLILYIILIIIDIYILGSIDFIEDKIYGVIFVVVNACLISFIRYARNDKTNLNLTRKRK